MVFMVDRQTTKFLPTKVLPHNIKMLMWYTTTIHICPRNGHKFTSHDENIAPRKKRYVPSTMTVILQAIT